MERPLAVVGFVGLGRMGWPMAHNLAQDGRPPIVHDADGERAAAFAAEHPSVAVAVGPGDFATADLVITMLPDDRAVTEVIADWQGGIAAALRSDAVVVDMSSSNPIATRALGDRITQPVVDAPVSGGVPRAVDGTLTIMAGADDEAALATVLPVLEILGARVVPCGPLGSGHAMKALNNFVAGAAYSALAEALVIGERYGLAPETMLDVINTSTGRSFSSEMVFAREVVTGRYGTGFALGLLAKDTSIAASLARSAEVDAPSCALTQQRWQQAAEQLGGDADHSEAHRAWFPASPD
jgi:3-hydroxyisobutyrate dehydrogenase